MSNIDYSLLYDKVIKHWSHLNPYINKDDIIEKTRIKESIYNSTRRCSIETYLATIMRSYIVQEYVQNKKRIDRDTKIKLILS